MTNRLSIRLRATVIILSCLLSTLQFAWCWQTVEYAEVTLGGQTLFSVTDTGAASAQQRAQDISNRLSSIVNDPASNISQLSMRTGVSQVPVIVMDDRTICFATKQDAAAFGQSQVQLTGIWFEKIKAALAEAKPSKDSTQTPRVSAELSEHAVLLLFLEIAILLMASLICGEAFVRLGQPAIIGQIVAGLLLGQTFFGRLFPDISAMLFPQDGSQSKLIDVVSWIGVSFVLMLTGMKTDIAALKRLGKPALYFAFLGLLGPLLVGAAVSVLVPVNLLQSADERLAFAIFLGTVFAVSSVPTVAEILMDLKMLQRDIGQLVLSAALSHDLLCCLLLAVIAVVSGTGTQSIAPLVTAILGTVVFVSAMYFGRPLFFGTLRWVNDKISTRYGLITAMVALLLLCAAATEAAGVHIVLGAFAAGVILSQSPVINSKLVRPLEIVTMSIFAPIFYAAAGLNVDLTALAEPKLAIITILLTLTAIASKIGFCYLAGKATGVGTWESICVGIGSNTRGSMGIILAVLGYTLNIITIEMFTIVIFVSTSSTALAASLMKWSLLKVQTSAEETTRVANQERQARTLLSSIRRVLWPTSGQGRNLFIAKLLNSIGRQQVIETTLFWVKNSGSLDKPPFALITDALETEHVGVLKRSVTAIDPIEAITEEANHGYDLIVMTTDKPSADVNHVFGELVDNIILNTSTRALVMHTPEKFAAKEIKRLLVPVSGSELSLMAGEFGISLANALAAKVTCVCIEKSEASELYSDETRSGEKIEQNITNEIEGSLSDLAKALKVDFEATLLPTTLHTAQAIILSAEQHKSDLIVLGAEPKLGKGLFLGHTINYILRHAPCAVVVLKV